MIPKMKMPPVSADGASMWVSDQLLEKLFPEKVEFEF
jgi:hypothetical protein